MRVRSINTVNVSNNKCTSLVYKPPHNKRVFSSGYCQVPILILVPSSVPLKMPTNTSNIYVTISAWDIWLSKTSACTGYISLYSFFVIIVYYSHHSHTPFKESSILEYEFISTGLITYYDKTRFEKSKDPFSFIWSLISYFIGKFNYVSSYQFVWENY